MQFYYPLLTLHMQGLSPHNLRECIRWCAGCVSRDGWGRHTNTALPQNRCFPSKNRQPPGSSLLKPPAGTGLEAAVHTGMPGQCCVRG